MPSDLQVHIPGLDVSGRCLARLSARSGLLTDLRRLLDQGGAENPDGIREMILSENALARSSDSARAKLYKELKGRYLFDIRNPLFQAFLKEWKNAASDDEKNLLAFCLLALNDRTVALISSEWFVHHLRKPESDLRVADLETFLFSKGKSTHPEFSHWTASTLRRVAQHYLATVRDCGMATGTLKKLAHRPALYASPVRLLLSALLLSQIPPELIISHESFKILGIIPAEVGDTLAELNRQGALRFRQQADIIELSL